MSSTRSAQEKQQLKNIIKETIQELLADETLLNKITKSISDKLNEKITKTEESIKTLEHKVDNLEKQIENLQQNEKVNNICIYGIKEEQHENLSKVITELINNNLGLTIEEKDIVQSYRIGHKTNLTSSIRPVIVKLKSHEHKYTILKNSSKFKGKKVFITEDLTQSRRKLLKEAKMKLGEKVVWPHKGIILAKINGNTVKIRNSEDILTYSVMSN